MQILALADELIDVAHRYHLAHLAVSVLDGQTPIQLVSILDVVVLLHQAIDAVVDAALSDYDVIALLQHFELFLFDHFVVLPEISLYALLQPLADACLHGLLEVTLRIGKQH
jgi:hypothetical protein